MDEFLARMFGPSISAERRLVLFTVPERRARFFDEISSASHVASKLSQSQNVYFGVGLIQGTPTGRGKQNDIAGIGALWADVDFAGEAHADKALPSGEDDFQRLLIELPMRPSLIVDSGHGRHLYWLLQAPWMFADADERNHAASLAKAWHGLVCVAAQSLGWSLENLGDLTRVLRLPNTVNRKHPNDPRPVQLVEADFARRYTIDDFERFLPAEPPTLVPVPEQAITAVPNLNLALPPDAEPPADKLVAAILESPTFRETWDRTRSDLSDDSASGYDLSLATLAMLRGWSDSETARLLVAWRRRHDLHPEKALRAGYMDRTLARARKATVSEVCETVDLSGFHIGHGDADKTPPSASKQTDPGPLPDELLCIPGFVNEVKDHCLATAPYPNPVMAFCGAIALQAFLAGRKVRDPGDNRTNLYLLGLAHSAAGKDWPRKINTRILHEVGLAGCVGERFASGEGIQDALFLSPSMLFQTDEIDGMLQSINKARDNRHENIMTTLLTMYSSGSSVFPMRRKAGKESPGVIDQPCLTIFGTAIPNHYYDSLSERMLTNGFFARMIILECSRRGTGQEPQICELPRSIIESARWWCDFRPGTGNLSDWHPVPTIVPQTPQAQQVLIDARLQAESEYERCEAACDAVGTTVWGRVSEQTRKLALIYAISQCASSPEIGLEATEWAVRFVMHQTRRMLFMASDHVARGDFDAMCKELLRVLRDWKQSHDDKPMPEWELNRRLPWKPKDHEDVRESLINQQRIHYEIVSTKTRPRKLYTLIE